MELFHTPLLQQLYTQLFLAHGIERVQHVNGGYCLFQPTELATEQLHFILENGTRTVGYPMQAGGYFIVAAAYNLKRGVKSEPLELIQQFVTILKQ
jgi:hypothetical protein